MGSRCCDGFFFNVFMTGLTGCAGVADAVIQLGDVEYMTGSRGNSPGV